MILNWYYLKSTRLSLDYCYLKSKKQTSYGKKNRNPAPPFGREFTH